MRSVSVCLSKALTTSTLKGPTCSAIAGADTDTEGFLVFSISKGAY